MTFLKVLLAILLVLWLFSLVRIGGRVSYGRAGLFIYLLMGPVKLQLFGYDVSYDEDAFKVKYHGIQGY